MNSSLSARTPTDDLKHRRKKECFEMGRHFYFPLVHRESRIYLVPWKKCEYFDTGPGNHVERDVSFSWGGTFFACCLFINAVLDYNLAFMTITARACCVFSSLADPGNGPSRPEGQVAQSFNRGHLKMHLGPWTSFILFSIHSYRYQGSLICGPPSGFSF